MRKIKLILTSTLLSCVLAHAQPFIIMSGTGTSVDGLTVSYETRLVPSPFPPRAHVFPWQPFRIGGGIIVSDKAFHRFIVNRAEKAYFGYDVTIESVGGDLLSVSILPLTIGPEQMNLEKPRIWRGLGLPRYPPKQVVLSGERWRST